MQAIVADSLTGTETKVVHKFELAGLGKAPFAFMGMEEKVYVSCQGAPEQPAGTCDYCGMGIRYVFNCRSADGKTFGVGCDCITKIGDAGLKKLISKAEGELRAKRNAKAKANKLARLAVRVAAAKEALPAVSEKLAALPHPSDYHNRNGLTLLDYANWCMNNRADEKFAATVESVQ